MRLIFSLLLLLPNLGAVTAVVNFKDPPHRYLDHEPADRFSLLKKQLESGAVKLDTDSDKGFLASLLKALDIPVSSQLLVFSASSFQSGIINPRNPRALYFNEDTYVGYVPGGSVEIISMDPEMGGIFYIFERLSPGRLPTMGRSEKCFNCHAGNATRRVPGLIVESLLPMVTSGASLEAYRSDEQGHHIALEKRFGGWHLTGEHHLKNTHANLMGRSLQGRGFEKIPVEPGQLWDLDRHLRPTSDILPHLVHEHQIGFENRVFHAAYVMRQLLADGRGNLPMSAKEEVDQLADELARYILFADEAKLPAQGVAGDPAFITEFQRNKKPAAGGVSLKDFDLRNRIFKFRCSYMLYTESWLKLPQALKERVYYKMAEGLREQNANPVYAHLAADEKRAIRTILKETLPGLPSWWR
ncbi:MAG TPA: hypothetical protein VD994_16185 [Prosthecobacter sp.]|nr:hypothetical protein [Prosthecobacter sp.]